MKPLGRRMHDAAKAGGVTQIVVERDYAQSYVLLGIARTAALRDALLFKGGTALRKVYFGDYRFSEDLDFSAVDAPKAAALARSLGAAVGLAQEAAQHWSPVRFTVERHEERDPHPGGQEAFVIRVQFPWQRQAMVPVKVEITHDEPVLLPARVLPVHHGYEESLDVAICSYSLEEICAEKLRAARQTVAKIEARGWARSRARDFYDLWRLAALPAGHVDWAEVARVLPAKAARRGVDIATIDDIFESRLMEEVRHTWERTLGPFVPDLPEVELVLTETRARLSSVLRLVG